MTTRPPKRKSFATTLRAGIVLSLTLTVSAAQSDRGTREAGPEDGVVCCNFADRFLFDGNRVLVMTGRAGVFRSEHRGDGWQRSMTGLVGPNGVSPYLVAMCQAESESRVVYAVTGLSGDGGAPSVFDGLFASDDFGKTWRRRAPVINGSGQFIACDVDPQDSRTVYVSGWNLDFVFEMWKSTDSGRTVRRVDAPPMELGFVRVVRGAIYLHDVLQGRLYTSTDGGDSFQPFPTPPGLLGNFDASPDGQLVFVMLLDETFTPTGTFRSSDRGVSYDAVSGLPNGLTTLRFDPTDPSRVFTTDGLLYVSTDGGLNFALVPASDDPRFFGGVVAVGVDSRGSVYINAAAGLFRSDDDGQTFRSLLKDFRASAVQDLAFDADGKLLVGVLHTRVLFRQTDGRDFRPIGDTPLIDLNRIRDAFVVAASPTDAKVLLVAVSTQGLFRTDDGGRSWAPAEMPDSLRIFFNARMTFATASRVYLVMPYFFGSGLYRSDDAGRTFRLLSNVPFGAIAVDPTDPDVLYVGDHRGGTGLFKSTDGGQTLQDLGRPGNFSALAIDPRNPNVIYAGERFGQVLRSQNGGLTFESASSGLAGAGVHGLVHDARDTLFAWLRGGGLFSSGDGASSWKPVDTEEARRRSGVESGRGTLVADPRLPGRLYLGHAGVLQIDVDDRDDDSGDDGP